MSKILFIPYAVKDYDGYIQKVKPAFEKIGKYFIYLLFFKEGGGYSIVAS